MRSRQKDRGLTEGIASYIPTIKFDENMVFDTTFRSENEFHPCTRGNTVWKESSCVPLDNLILQITFLSKLLMQEIISTYFVVHYVTSNTPMSAVTSHTT
jgi:hypothetical protein